MNNSVSVSVSGMKALLPPHFTPRPLDVIVGRQSKTNKAHNEHFQKMIEEVSAEYSNAANKGIKSHILLNVVNQIKMKGTFVRRDIPTNRWYVVEDSVARTTAAQMMRDCLHSNYKSSRQFKQQRRLRQEMAEQQQVKSSFASKMDYRRAFTVFGDAVAIEKSPLLQLREPDDILSFPAFPSLPFSSLTTIASDSAAAEATEACNEDDELGLNAELKSILDSVACDVLDPQHLVSQAPVGENPYEPRPLPEGNHLKIHSLRPITPSPSDDDDEPLLFRDFTPISDDALAVMDLDIFSL